MTDFIPSVQTFTVTAGGTAEELLGISQVRSSVIIQPLTENCLINFGLTAGVQATGTLQFDANPANDETISVNAVPMTFKTTVADPSVEILIGADATETRDNFIAFLNASATAGIALATYSETVVSSDPAVLITYDAGGTDGNAYALADSSAAAVLRSAATLSGGSNSAGGLLLALNGQYIYDAVQFPQIKQPIYVLSASDNAKISILEGNGA